MSTESCKFPKFSLPRLLKTVFDPQPGESIAIIIDLDDPQRMENMSFLKDQASSHSIQRHAFFDFFEAIQHGRLTELRLKGGEMFAIKKSGGSNLDLEDEAVDVHGKTLSLDRDIYSKYDIILFITTYSATAPATAKAKQFSFRGATLHGVNAIILASGLSVNYFEVSEVAERMRLGMTRAESISIDFTCLGESFGLRIDLGGQEAQKSHGLCPYADGPDIANLPAGEIYFVPVELTGSFPYRYADGTLAECFVQGNGIVDIKLLRGEAVTVENHLRRLRFDPMIGVIGELGFGTQELPVSGRDIQDEKILGTVHLATGRSDHLGGSLTPDKFKLRENATHDDHLFAPQSTPEIMVDHVILRRDGETYAIIKRYRPSDYVLDLRRGLVRA